MLIRIIIFLFSYFVIDVVCSEDGILVGLTPDEVIDTFQTVVKSEFINKLANEFASKATQRLIEAMKKKGKIMKEKQEELEEKFNITSKYYRQQTATEDQTETIDTHLLDEEEALVLLDEPSPDGDNLEKPSPYLSDEAIDTSTKTVPVIGVMKINGVYFRRYLGNFNYNK